MGAPLDAFVAGQYFGFYTPPNVAAAGLINYPSGYTVARGDGAYIPAADISTPTWIGATHRGFTLTTQVVGEPVEGDIWGGSIVDIVYRGGNCRIGWEAIAFRYGSVVPYWPWATLGTMGTVGRLGSTYGGNLVLVAAPGTTAADFPTIGQLHMQAITAQNAIIVPNNSFPLIFDSRLRKVPVELQLLPFYDSLVTVSEANSTLYGKAGIIDATGGQNVVVASTATRVTQVANYKWFSIA
jgi:hypothetical protein